MNDQAYRRRMLGAALSMVVLGALFFALFKVPDHLVLDTGANARPLGPLTSEKSFVQELSLGSVGQVAAIDVLLATYGAPSNTTHDALQVLDGEGREVYRETLEPGVVTDNSYHRVNLPRPLDAGPYHRLFIVLSSSDGTLSNSITVWTTANASYGRLFVLRTGSAPSSSITSAVRGAKQSKGDLCVRLSGLGSKRLAGQALVRGLGLGLCLLAAVGFWIAARRSPQRAPAYRLRKRVSGVQAYVERSPLGRLGRGLSENHLIKFDVRTQLLCVSGAVLFVVLVAGGIHYSSIEMWNQVLPSDVPGVSDSSLLLGTPKVVRSDEWAVATPELLNDYLHADQLPATTRALDIARPWNWGYYALGLERGFSLMWNFWVLGSLFAMFFLAMLLTRNDFGLSVFAGIFVLFSSYNRWWNITAEVTCFSAVLIAMIYLLQSQKRLNIWLAWISLCVFGLRFVMLLYPAWQVTLGVLIVFIAVGYSIRGGLKQHLKQHASLKIALVIATVVAGVIGAVAAYARAADTIHTMMSTVYPGRRLSTGGDLDVYHFFSGYLDYFFTQERYFFTNICESSGFILLFPFVIIGLLVEAVYTRSLRVRPLVVALLAYVVILCVYMLVGFGPVLSRLTLLSFVPATRAVIGVGLASLLLCVLHLALPDRPRLPAWLTVSITLLSFGAFLAFSYGFERRYGFPPVATTWSVAAALAVAVGALLFRQKALFAGVMLLLVLVPSIGTNPVATGLKPIYGKRLIEAVGSIAESHPGEKWLVYGDRWIPQIVKAGGADVVNGAGFPQTTVMQSLDPSGANAFVWNRFAHIQCQIAPRGTVTFTLNALDWYTLAVNPADARLLQAGIRLYVMPATDERLLPAAGLRVLTPEPLNGYVIVERTIGPSSMRSTTSRVPLVWSSRNDARWNERRVSGVEWQ